MKDFIGLSRLIRHYILIHIFPRWKWQRVVGIALFTTRMQQSCKEVNRYSGRMQRNNSAAKPCFIVFIQQFVLSTITFGKELKSTAKLICSLQHRASVQRTFVFLRWEVFTDVPYTLTKRSSLIKRKICGGLHFDCSATYKYGLFRRSGKEKAISHMPLKLSAGKLKEYLKLWKSSCVLLLIYKATVKSMVIT